MFLDLSILFEAKSKNGCHTVLYAYSLGKAQRLLSGLDHSIGPVAVHGAVSKMNSIYAQFNRLNFLPPNLTKELLLDWDQPGLIVAPPGAIGSAWLKKLGKYREGYVSGWMTSKGQARRRNMHGFVISDHADWNGLIKWFFS